MAKRYPLHSVSLSFGEGARDDVIIDVTGLQKAELKRLVLDAVHEALRKDKRIKDLTTCT